jgi:hypothetical protein
LLFELCSWEVLGRCISLGSLEICGPLSLRLGIVWAVEMTKSRETASPLLQFEFDNTVDTSIQPRRFPFSYIEASRSVDKFHLMSYHAALKLFVACAGSFRDYFPSLVVAFATLQIHLFAPKNAHFPLSLIL